jgi:hypothetical protein
MSNKRRVILTIHHRDELSLGSNRTQLGYAACHWGILIQPKKPKGSSSNAYDVSNGAKPDPITRQDLNPNFEWRFRTSLRVNHRLSGHLLGRVMIGKVPNNVTDAQIEAILGAVPLPVKNATPEQNCVTWILAAIRALQQHGLAEAFDVNQFLASALQYGHSWLDDPGPNKFYNYTDRPD